MMLGWFEIFLPCFMFLFFFSWRMAKKISLFLQNGLLFGGWFVAWNHCCFCLLYTKVDHMLIFFRKDISNTPLSPAIETPPPSPLHCHELSWAIICHPSVTNMILTWVRRKVGVKALMGNYQFNPVPANGIISWCACTVEKIKSRLNKLIECTLWAPGPQFPLLLIPLDLYALSN